MLAERPQKSTLPPVQRQILVSTVGQRTRISDNSRVFVKKPAAAAGFFHLALCLSLAGFSRRATARPLGSSGFIG